ncbi:hypothetical protein KAI04_04395 [Candidatus Pacearchaeota archaeon]|nr:hypothetical protein [Candidatus Pacearchaeota archaeon]
MTFHKYTKIYIIGHEENQEIFQDPEDDIIIEEKIDGANFRFYINEHGQIIFGSRAQELSEDKEHKYAKNFQRCIEFISDKLYNDKIDLSLYKNMIFYGECCVKHSLSYDWDKIPPYLGFDIRKKDESYIPFIECQDVFLELGLPFVPVIKICKAKDITNINEDMVPISKYSLNQAEGIVFKNYDKQIFAKFVTDKFKEKNSEAFGGTPKYGVGDDAKIVLKYCTNARIDKMVFKLLDEECKLEMAMMKFLPNRVFDDMIEENYNEIVHNREYKSINFQNCRKLVTKRCLNVLKQIITNNALNKK